MGLIATIVSALGASGQFAEVGRAADHAAAITQAQHLPAAYVVLSEVHAEPNELIGGIHQYVEETVDIVIGIGNASDAGGAAAADELDTARTAVRIGVLGLIEPDYSRLVYVGGYLIGYSTGVLWWTEQYSVQRAIST